jgi:hypothetical protein
VRECLWMVTDAHEFSHEVVIRDLCAPNGNVKPWGLQPTPFTPPRTGASCHSAIAFLIARPPTGP